MEKGLILRQREPRIAEYGGQEYYRINHYCPFCGGELVNPHPAQKYHIYCKSRIDSIRKNDWKRKKRERKGKRKSQRQCRKKKGKECENCGYGGLLCVHHKDGSHRNNKTENLMTLCFWCHGYYHSVGRYPDEETARSLKKGVENE